MSLTVLGLSGALSHDPSAALYIDGKLIAAICSMNNGFWTFDSNTGELRTAEVQQDGITVANIKTIVPQMGDVGRPAYPNFSPGNEWLVYGRPTEGSR